MKKYFSASLLRVIFLSLFFILLFSASGYSQIELSGPTTGEYYANKSIKLKPGFSTKGPFRAYISNKFNEKLGSSPSKDQNYVITNIFKKAGITDLDNARVSEVSQSIQYFDGLGRPSQIIQTKGSPSGNDLVQPIVYDSFGRESYRYLPYAEQSGNGSYKANALQSQAQFYGASGWDASVPKTNDPYSQSVFEPSPLNRLVEQGYPGTLWQPAGEVRNSTSGRTTLIDYEYNTSDGDYAVRLWSVVPVTGEEYKMTLNGNGNYGSSRLYIKIRKNENWVSSDGKVGTVEEYTDKNGRLVLKRNFNKKDNKIEVLSTYYVFDDLGNLSFVLPPGANPDAATIDQNSIDLYCYEYRYDGSNRLIEKRIPGKGWEYLVYNNLDQIVLSQDGVQRKNGQWSFNKYDGLGRTVITGLYNDVSLRPAMQATVNKESSSVLWEQRSDMGNGYSNVAFPRNIATYYNIYYYDNYNFPGASDYAYTGSSKTIGLLTGSKTNVLGTSNMLMNVNYYNDEGRFSKSYKQHYQSGVVDKKNYDENNSVFNFEGLITQNTRIHYNVKSGNTTIVNRYEYDHLSRIARSYEKINSGAEVLLSENVYNEIGLLQEKSLSDGKQKTAYTYNERGWLKSSTSDQFSQLLKYQDGTNPQYDGNVSDQFWGAGSTVNNKFVYTYDRLNRLSSGVNTGMSEIVTYDVMGNIQSLNRNGLTRNYSYVGNQLSKTTGGLEKDVYKYDENGNSIVDGRNGQSITYNNLNLPDKIAGLNLSYLYDAGGNKLKKTSGNEVTDYVGGIHYKNGAIEFIQTEVGIARRNGTSYSYEYNLTDHLGNVRYSFYQNPASGKMERIQSDDYFPFGLRNSSGSPVSLNNKYLYNGKELQDESGQYDYGARFYDPVIGRFSTVDPLAEFHFNTNPYHYVLNNPIMYIDPLGLDTVKPNQIVPPTPGVRPLNDTDVIQLDEASIVSVRPNRSVQDNTRNDNVPLTSQYATLSPGTTNRTLDAGSNIQSGLDVVNEINPKIFKFAKYSGNALKVIDLMNSRNGKEAEDKVLGFALEQVATKFIGSGTAVTVLQLTNSYFNNTARGLSDMANAENREMIFNRNQYRITNDEMYLKREGQANQRMYEYLIKMRKVLSEK